MKAIYKFRYEIILMFLISSFISLLIIEPQTEMGIHFRAFGRFAIFVPIFFTLRKLYREKWRKAFVIGAQRILISVAKLFMRIAEKWGISSSKNKNIISGKTKIQFNIENITTIQKSPSKSPRWKQLKNEREKLRYLYRHMITQKIKHGARIYPNQTPMEIELDSPQNTPSETIIFNLYSTYRYDERTNPSEEHIEKIKDNCYRNLK